MESQGKEGVNYNLVIWLAIVFVVWKFSDSILSALKGGDEGKKEGEILSASGTKLDVKKYIEEVKKTKLPKGKKLLTLSNKKVGEIVDAIEGEFSKVMAVTRANESIVSAQLKYCQTIGDLARVSNSYTSSYKKDLYSEIKKTFSDEEQKDLFSVLNKLPMYI